MSSAVAGSARGGGSSGAYAAALLTGLLSAAAVTLAVARPWYAASATVKNLPELQSSATGADLVPLAGALGVVLLGSFGAVIATRGWVRRALGLLIVACAIVVLVAVAHPGSPGEVLREGLSARGWSGGSYATTGQAWRWLALLGSVGCVAAGTAVARLGAQWPTMGQRYDAPRGLGDSPAETDADLTQEQLWRALDQGQDPTQRP